MPPSRVNLQGRVLFALVLREMTTRFGRSTGGYVWAVLEPAGFVALLSVLFSQISHRPPLGDDFPLFYATGYVAFHSYMDISRNTSLSVRVNRPLFSFPRVTMLDAIIARFLLQFVTTLTVGVLIVGGLLLMDGRGIVIDLKAVLAAWGLAALLGLGVGSLNCVLYAYSQTWERVFGVINRPLFLISGVFFIMESLPDAAQALLWWNPLIHITAIMRAGFYPFYDPSFVSPAYVAFCALTPLTAGLLLLRLARRHMLEEL